MITNLNELLGTVDSRHQELTQLIQELRRWVGGLAEDRVQIGRSVVNISELTRPSPASRRGAPDPQGGHRRAAPADRRSWRGPTPARCSSRSSATCPRCSRTRPGPAPTAPGTTTTSAASRGTSSSRGARGPRAAQRPHRRAEELLLQLHRARGATCEGLLGRPGSRASARSASWSRSWRWPPRSTCRSSPASGARPTRRSSPTRAGCTRATWCRSPASASAGSARSSSPATTSSCTSRSTRASSSATRLDRLDRGAQPARREVPQPASPTASEQLEADGTIPLRAHRLQLRHRQGLHRAVRHHREHRHPAAPGGAGHGRRHDEPHQRRGAR